MEILGHKYLFEWDKDKTTWENVVEYIDDFWQIITPWGWLYRLPHKLVSDWPYEIKWAWQRVFRGYDDRVTWDVSYYLGPMILEALRNFKKSDRMGYPVLIWEGVEGMDQNFNMPEGVPDPNIAKWEQILDDMIEGWEFLVNHDEWNEKITEEFGDVREPEETFMGYKMDGKKWNSKCTEEMNRLTKDKTEKAKLMVEHWWGLWD